ncbi:MAG: glycosyltransferase family 2 protein [Bacteroidales bacterium]|nr:glycosyltransferase family 2 protein [Bacteroidales bacterium]MCF8343872.1 glycosyltransferase family 2 protein [Bacteroidales bacterium]MCF8351882.1 glycosyltransferase family 2 protein [Bacteroidales bacterium]MCF8375255.1 glycosyltransferase family 2 protein [Bacteroidales bacterium]MCF8400279.1 glycosyltransferase family 2 protein [Bacteroidales bacterium]
MGVTEQIIFIIQAVVFFYLLIAALYYTVFALAGMFASKFDPPENTVKRRFCILIPGYKEDIVIVNVAEDALKQAYPRNKFDVYVIADSFKKETLDKLANIPVHVIEVQFDVSTKARSINKALETIPEDYDGIVILDADNLMDLNFLKKMNAAMGTGLVAIQAHRMAKNLNTSFAVLDAISEEVNNHIFRRGHRTLGLSSALIGSGMTFDFKLYKTYMASIDSLAEDKDLEIKLFDNRHLIEFYDTAYVLDEKVSKSDVFLRQRSRWIANQLLYARKFFFKSVIALFKGKIDFFDKIFQHFLPPRILLLGAIYLIFILSLIFNPWQHSVAWLAVFLLVNLAIAFSVPKRFYNRHTLKHLLRLPQGFLLMLMSLLNFSDALKSFNPTPKTGDNDSDNNKNVDK